MGEVQRKSVEAPMGFPDNLSLQEIVLAANHEDNYRVCELKPFGSSFTPAAITNVMGPPGIYDPVAISTIDGIITVLSSKGTVPIQTAIEDRGVYIICNGPIRDWMAGWYVYNGRARDGVIIGGVPIPVKG